MDYDETWSAMQNLEDAFNRITGLRDMVDDLQEAVDTDNHVEIANLTKAISAFIPVYITQYDKASKRAWNKTVRSIKRERNNNYNYEEIKYGLSLEEDLRM